MPRAFLQPTPLSQRHTSSTEPPLSPRSPRTHTPQPTARRTRRHIAQSTASKPTPPSQQQPSPAVQPVSKHAVIVGGGPAGLASMLLLHERNLATRITVLERNAPSAASTSPQAPTREFAYLFDWRGGRFLDELPALRRRVKAAGQPSNPSIAHVFPPDGKGTSFELQPDSTPELHRFYFWIRRSSFLQVCMDYFAAVAGSDERDVRVLQGTSCRDIRFGEGERPIRVTYADEAGAEHVLEADLLIGADGLHSVVRSSLLRENEAGNVASSGSGPGFAMETWTSPAVGMRYKSLRIPSGRVYLSESGSEGSEIEMAQETYIFRGKPTSLLQGFAFNVGCFPVGPHTSFGRLGTIVLKPDHPLWDVHDVDECYKIFEATFPQLHVRKMIPPEEMQRFAAVDAASFPLIQRAGGFVAHVGQGAVALVGDSAHCFPPDMGQGVNSALEDIVELCDGLQSEGLHGGVDFYERRRDEDIRSFMRIMRLANPYQYGQNKFRVALYFANRVFRTRLWKLAPDFFKPQISVMIYRRYSYSEILRLADETTLRISGVSAVLIAVIGAGVWYMRHGW